MFDVLIFDRAGSVFGAVCSCFQVLKFTAAVGVFTWAYFA